MSPRNPNRLAMRCEARNTEAAGPSPTSVGACSFPSAEWRERCVARCHFCSRSGCRTAHPAHRSKPIEFRSAVERRAILLRGVRSRSDYGSALRDSGPNDDRQHDRVIVSLDLRRCLEAPGSGKASPPVSAPTGCCRTRRCWALRSPAREEPRNLLRPTSSTDSLYARREWEIKPEIQLFSSRTRTPRPRAATRQKRSSGTANGAASSSVGNHAVRKRSPYSP